MRRDDLENGMVLRGEDEGEILTTCACCGKPIYVGSDYYELCGEEICEDCILSAKKTA